MNEHLSEDRLLELLKECGEFSKDELQHLADCQECAILLVAVRESLFEG